MPDPVLPVAPAVSVVPAAPAAPPVIEKRDFLGVAQPVYAGADSAAVPEPVTGDRGDSFVPTPSVVPAVPVAPVAAPVAAPVVATPLVPEPATEPAISAAPEEPVRDEKGRFVPRDRFNEVNEKRKTAEAKLAEIDRQAEAAKAGATQTYDFDAKEKQYAELLVSGEVDQAIALRREIRAAEQESYVVAARTQAQDVTERASVQERIQAVTDSYEQEFADAGIFDQENPNFNEPLLEDVKAMFAGYLDTGRFQDRAQAWNAAIENSLKLHGIARPSAATAAPVAPAAAPPPVVPTAAARVAAIASQPPSLAGTGLPGDSAGATAIDVTKLTDAEMAALPATTRARLRGDFV